MTPHADQHRDVLDRGMPELPGPRVLHLDHTSSAGGAEYALARMLHADPPWQPLLLLAGGKGLGAYESLSGTIPIRFCGVDQKAGASSSGTRVLLDATTRLLAQAATVAMHPAFRSADLIDANTARAAAYGALAARTRRVSFVVHLRDLTDADALGRSGLTTMTRLVLPRADGVIANSQTTLAAAMPWLRADAVRAVIPSASGLTHVPARAHARKVVRGKGEPLMVGMLARIDPWKGQDFLLDAFAATLSDSNARLQFAGAPLFGHTDFEDQLRLNAKQLGVADRVDFLGHVDDVPALLATWDVAVHYSTRPEPLGQNVLQYLAAGVPTIVADEGGPTEWVEDDVNGLRARPRDIRSLSAALSRLASAPELRARLGAAAVATPGLLDDHEVAAAHAAFYAKVLSVNGQPLRQKHTRR
ncbi:glycosyltransferase family 4 protein [Rathayibacter soli]|uniref:glycosyltransferase family 4 protein n=1 Tax=Rathayibacter soli TaxID=3144168 RepID=UPI0027E55DD2|nr:glycosyltransferase family 4 protein [Glaciibacter superstes]